RRVRGMRRDDHVVERPERALARERLHRERVERRAADEPGLERLRESGLVDDRATRDVHDPRSGLHAPDDRTRDRATRGMGQRSAYREVVGFRDGIPQLLGRDDPLYTRDRRAAAANTDHAHAQCRREARGLGADAAQTEDDECGATELLLVVRRPLARALLVSVEVKAL